MSSWIGREQRESEQVRNFVALTGASEDEARHHLEETGWNSTVALARYQNIDISNRPEVRPTFSTTRSQTESPAFMPRSNPAFATVVVDESPKVVKEARKQSKRDDRSKRPSTSTSKLMTLAELDNFSSDEDDDEHFVNLGREAAARSESFATRGQNAEFLDEDRQHLISFSGAGYSLMSPTTATTSSSNNNDNDSEAPRVTIEVTVTFWKKGYSIDNGELRRMSEKRHRDFLRSLNEGILPLELSSRAKSSSRASFKIHLVDRKTESYVPPSAVALGRTISDARSSSTSSPHRNDIDELKHKLSSTKIESPVVDETKPTTQIMVRLVSGESATLVLNSHHRLRDLFASIESRYPSHGRPFQLRLSYPRKVFGFSHATEEELNSSLETLQLMSTCLIQEFV